MQTTLILQVLRIFITNAEIPAQLKPSMSCSLPQELLSMQMDTYSKDSLPIVSFVYIVNGKTIFQAKFYVFIRISVPKRENQTRASHNFPTRSWDRSVFIKFIFRTQSSNFQPFQLMLYKEGAKIVKLQQKIFFTVDQTHSTVYVPWHAP